MRFGGPIVFEKFWNVDLFATLLLRPRQMSALHFDLDAQLGCRRNISTYAQALEKIRGEEKGDIQVLS